MAKIGKGGSNLKMDTSDVERALKEFQEKLNKDILPVALKQLLEEAKKELVELAKQGKKFDGSSQKRNAPATSAKKGGKPPLVDTGVLTDESGYNVQVINNIGTIQTTGRNLNIIQFLEEKGYIYFRLPTHIKGITLDKRLEQILEELTRNIIL